LILVSVFASFCGTPIKPSLFERPEPADLPDVLSKTRDNLPSAMLEPILDRQSRHDSVFGLTAQKTLLCYAIVFVSRAALFELAMPAWA
jgi:hypothetical protein